MILSLFSNASSNKNGYWGNIILTAFMIRRFWMFKAVIDFGNLNVKWISCRSPENCNICMLSNRGSSRSKEQPFEPIFRMRPATHSRTFDILPYIFSLFYVKLYLWNMFVLEWLNDDASGVRHLLGWKVEMWPPWIFVHVQDNDGEHFYLNKEKLSIILIPHSNSFQIHMCLVYN